MAKLATAAAATPLATFNDLIMRPSSLRWLNHKCLYRCVRKITRDACAARCISISVSIRFSLARQGGEPMPHVVTKSDLVQVAAKAGNVSKVAANEVVNAVFEAIVSNVAKGKRVTLVGFGTFLPRTRKARSGRSPVNGKEIKISAKTIPAFAAGQGFKEA